MSTLKTIKTNASVTAFLDTIEDEQKRKDAYELLKIFKEVTGEEPVLWGTSIVGFGQYHYKSERSRQEGDWPLTGFSPRKQNLTIYIMPGFDGFKDELQKLGKHKTSVGCLYVKQLSDIDIEVLKKMIREAVAVMKKNYAVK